MYIDQRLTTYVKRVQVIQKKETLEIDYCTGMEHTLSNRLAFFTQMIKSICRLKVKFQIRGKRCFRVVKVVCRSPRVVIIVLARTLTTGQTCTLAESKHVCSQKELNRL